MAAHRYRLTPAALRDLETIWRYSAEVWSLEQADRYITGLTLAFDTIAANPKLARERQEYVPPVRIHRYQAHIVIYRIGDDDVIIIRVRHGSEDWASDPSGST
ncbi:MAG: type II toxin-antitoxin system RelE/ParE family toxin [Pseudomonadota bacterium]|nr:type II toxin-antitoxin system RelE/ParE family toxin [Pseudomonadota bacterium]